MKAATSPARSCSLQGVEVPERDGGGLGSSVAEARRNSAPPLSASAPVVRPWKACSAYRILGRLVDCRANLIAASMDSAPELQKKTRLDARVRPGDELLGQQARQQGAVHLDHVRQVEVERLVQRGLDRRVAAAEGVDAESGQEVEVALPGVVVEVAALAADVVTVEAERPERPGELGVHVPLVQGEVLPGPVRERPGNIEGHGSPRTCADMTTILAHGRP